MRNDFGLLHFDILRLYFLYLTVILVSPSHNLYVRVAITDHGYAPGSRRGQEAERYKYTGILVFFDQRHAVLLSTLFVLLPIPMIIS